MNQEIFEWTLLIGRWVHIVTAVTWIGTSIFFMWLDRTFRDGELWMVHGGGFYHVKKLPMKGPVPELLHWFKWESYWTWLSGMFLLLLIFYTGGGTFLLDPSMGKVTFAVGAVIGFGSILVSWAFYDFLWERRMVAARPFIGHTLTLAWLAGVTWTLCHFLSGRAAYIHVGALLGSWMTGNVLMRIIPRQRKMVEAAKRGETPNLDWAKNAKARSTHNTYFTLPVIFIMLSNHFPMTYGHRLNWLILLVVGAGAAAIRHFFVIRVQAPSRARLFGVSGAVLVAGVVLAPALFKSSTLPAQADVSSPQLARLGAGRVEGEVIFEGDIPQGAALSVPLECAKNHPNGVFSNEISVKGGRLKNVLVRVSRGLEGKSFGPPPERPVVLDQVDCMYQPRVVAARVGQPVEIVNSDPLFHNVRSVTTRNESFNVGMASKNDRVTKIFSQPEIIVQTKCDVHPWMSGYIAVVEHPFFAVTGEDGRFEIQGLPPGRFALEFWHEKLGTRTYEFEVNRDETVQLNARATREGFL